VNKNKLHFFAGYYKQNKILLTLQV